MTPANQTLFNPFTDALTLIGGRRVVNLDLNDIDTYIADTELAPFADDERAEYEARIARAIYHKEN